MPLLKARSNVLLSNSFFIFIIRFFPSLANLLVLILYSRQLSQNDYGNYQHFWIQLYIIYPLICMGIHVLLVTYSADFILGLFRQLTRLHIGLYILWALTLSGVFAFLQQTALHISLYVPFLFMLSFSLSVVLETFLIVFRAYKSLVTISIIYSAAYFFIHFYILTHGFSLQAVYSLLLIITILRFCIYAVMTVVHIRRTGFHHAPDGVELKKARSLWLHLGFYDVTQNIFNWIDKFIISLVMTASVSAVYFNGSQNIPFLPLLLSAAGSAVLMQLASSDKENEPKGIVYLMNQSGKVLSGIVFPVFFFLFLFRHELIGILLLKYNAARPVFAVFLLVLPVRAYSFTTVLQRMHKGNIINAGSVGDIVLACALVYPLYRLFGLPGVALSFVITTYLQAAFYLYYSARLLRVSPLKMIPYANWAVKLIAFGILFTIVHFIGNLYFNSRITLFLGAMTMAVLVIGSLYVDLKSMKNGNTQ